MTKPVDYRVYFIALSLSLMVFSLLFGQALGVAPPWLILAIFCFGMPHGALDVLFATRLLDAKRWQAWLRFVLGYVLFAALILLCWWWLPTFSLVIFLLLSAYHFADDLDQTLAWPFKALHGVLLISLPAVWYAAPLTGLYQLVSDSPSIASVVEASRICALAALMLLGLSVGEGIYKRRPLPQRRQWLLMISAWGLMLTTPPLLAFTVYFCLLHSPQHLLRTQCFLNTSIRKLLSWPVWLASLAVCVLAGWWLLRTSTQPLAQGAIAVTFPILASLTYPHVWLLHRTRFAFRHQALANNP